MKKNWKKHLQRGLKVLFTLSILLVSPNLDSQCSRALGLWRSMLRFDLNVWTFPWRLLRRNGKFSSEEYEGWVRYYRSKLYESDVSKFTSDPIENSSPLLIDEGAKRVAVFQNFKSPESREAKMALLHVMIKYAKHIIDAETNTDFHRLGETSLEERQALLKGVDRLTFQQGRLSGVKLKQFLRNWLQVVEGKSSMEASDVEHILNQRLAVEAPLDVFRDAGYLNTDSRIEAFREFVDRHPMGFDLLSQLWKNLPSVITHVPHSLPNKAYTEERIWSDPAIMMKIFSEGPEKTKTYILDKYPLDSPGRARFARVWKEFVPLYMTAMRYYLYWFLYEERDLLKDLSYRYYYIATQGKEPPIDGDAILAAMRENPEGQSDAAIREERLERTLSELSPEAQEILQQARIEARREIEARKKQREEAARREATAGSESNEL